MSSRPMTECASNSKAPLAETSPATAKFYICSMETSGTQLLGRRTKKGSEREHSEYSIISLMRIACAGGHTTLSTSSAGRRSNPPPVGVCLNAASQRPARGRDFLRGFYHSGRSDWLSCQKNFLARWPRRTVAVPLRSARPLRRASSYFPARPGATHSLIKYL
jgi:hypothetical protein